MGKRIIMCMLLVLCMLTNGVAFAQQAAEDYDISVQVVTGLNLMSCGEDGEFHGEDAITREEFVITALRTLGISDVSPSAGEDAYKDVTDAHWSYAYIRLATEIGMVSGDENEYFYPDANISYDEANKIVVTMLGCRELAESKGGYPNGYNAVAGAKGVACGYGKEGITRFDAAQMIYEALDVNLMQYELSGKGEQYVSDETLLSEKLDVAKGQGVVTANSVTGIYGSGGETGEGKVEITENGAKLLFDVGDTNARELLGYRVEYYYYNNSDDENVLLAAVKLKTNQSVTIKAYELDEKTENSRIAYTPGGKSSLKHIKIPDNTPVLYNGVFRDFAGFAEDNLFWIESGELEIISDRSEVKLVRVMEYRDFRVSEKFEKDAALRLYFEENRYGTGSVKLDSEETEYEVYLGGKQIEAYEVQLGDIASVAADDLSLSAPKYVKILISRSTAEGSVTACDDEYISISGEEYRRAHSLFDEFKIGDSGIFYINYNGEVSYFSAGISTALQYGYLTYVFELDDNSDGNYCKFKILTASGEHALLYCGDKVRINDTKVDYSDVWTALERNQLIQYKQNADGKISQIYTAKKLGGNDYIGYDEDNFSCDSKPGVKYTYKSSAPVSFSSTDSLTGVYSAFLVTEDTLVFDISDDNPDEYYVGRAVDFFEDGITYTVELYDNDEYLHSAVAVYLGDVSSSEKVGWNNPAFIIDKVRQTLNADNELEYEIIGYENGESKTLIKSEEEIKDEGGTGIELASLKRGSVIQYTTNLKDKVNYYRLLYSPLIATVPVKAWKGSDINSQLTTLYGNVYTKSDDSITFTYDGGKTICAYSTGGINVYLYDSGDGTVEPSTMNEVGVYKSMAGGADLVFMRMYKGNIADMLIVR